ncbi:SnoaL-like domain protein [Methyloligella halotolerans]|uniref:SnoaL-like domain protein n=1 Tax=Methyloligella halotolerans TaxID=1177755 RepID=A0A1E2RXY6_9HYPH|nr:nuclear transport factor 2 family protein [Methyloligella halotolerans]ODA67097.1 SnoaL-like domain protein [Methyloligella halotolerans]
MTGWRGRALAALLATLAVLMPALAAAEGLKTPKDAVEIFRKATAEGDAAAIADLYAPKATLLMPDGKVATGRDQIRALNERVLSAGKNELTFRDVKVDGGDARAVMIWSWDRKITPEDGDPVTIRGRSMLYWLKGEDGWQIVVDMYQQVPQR